jgi:large subunit ribosomal protein L7/L12
MADEKTLSANAEKIMELVEKLTIVELADLVSAMEEKFGVSAAAAVVAGGAAGAAAAEEDEKTTVNVVMTSAGSAKIAVIKVVRELTGLGLGEAKALVDAGGNIKENVERVDAEKMKAQLEEAGATVELKA